VYQGKPFFLLAFTSDKNQFPSMADAINTAQTFMSSSRAAIVIKSFDSDQMVTKL
jgi:hypothetical protein